MEGVQSTALLRSAAPQWSLAGDAQLLDVLQSIHQNIITKCQETNTKLEQMVADLDNASISLQNVNNKFMALSNSQFIESRVYDYDEILVNQTVKPEETPSKPVDRQSELMKFSASLKVVEDMHEPVHIVGSDTDTDSEGEDGDSVVLKPKDVYAHRPLPYIIGSYAWKNKWHAGLEPDDSDTDSSISKPEREVEEYSDSEPELTENIQTDRLPAPVRTESSASSELVSDQDVSFTTKPTPSDVAAELARRLGGPVDKSADTESACAHTSTTARKVYKPQQPTTSTIFSDEPPPIDEFYQSESEYSDDNDIFAELYKNKPYANANRDQSVSDDLFGGFDDRNNNVSDDLFGRKVEAEDTFNDTDQWNEVSNTRDKQKSYLFEDESEPELFVEKPNRQTSKKDNAPSDITTVKKPVGGISLFSSNKGAENIGAAILKRNQRKSSSSDESESNVAETPKIVTQAVVEPKKLKEKDIFDDLFAKSKKLQKDSKVQESIQKEKAVIEHKKTKEKDIFDDLFAKSEKLKKNSSDNSKEDNIHKEKKVDLFNDNLFDDIDDIFTSGVVKMPNKDDKKKQKSIFDDDDDLFADVALTNTNTTDNIKPSNEAKSNKELFDSDDDLFNEEVKVNKELHNVTRPEINNDVSEVSKTSKVDAKTSIFDESDDELFSDNEPKNLVNNFINENTSNSASVKENKRIIKNETIVPGNTENNIEPDKAKPEIQVQPVRQTNVANNVDNKSNVENVTNIYDKSNTAKVFDSPSLFYEEDVQFCEVAPKQVENIKTTKIISDHETPTERNIEGENNSIKGSAVIDDIIETYEDKLPDTPENVKLLVENEFLDNDQQNVQNDIFKDSNVTTQNENVYEDPQRNVNFISEPTTADNYIEIGTNSTENDQKTNMQNYNEIPEEKDAHTNNDFNDIFGDLPPAFEKPKEPKKSKNVNALFDDDSDDEALFFKKNDAVLDEKPELSNTSEYLFGLFHDEPPAMDVDFKQKSNKTGFDISDDELFSSQPKTAQEESLSKIVTEPPPLQQPANMFEKDVNVVPTNTDFDISDDELFDSHPKRIRPTNKIINESPPSHQPKISKTSNDVLITKIANIKQKPNSIDFDDSEDVLFGSQPKTIKTQSSTETINKPPPIQKSDIVKTTEQSDTFTKTVVADETRSKFTDLDLSDDELFGSKPNTTEKRSSNQNIKETLQSTDSKITKTVDNNDINKNDDKKTVGKLKPINLNINVNTLLPGASPKKVKKIDQIDGQTVSTHSNEDLNTDVTIKDEPLMVKSVSFEGDPDSKVLDNKLSKERAKIQIKRRPSTRRARRDAARKSAIDFGNDSTDNSSSFDDKTASESTDKTDHKEQKGQDTIMDKIVPDETIESDAIKVLNIEKNIHNDVPKDIERASKVSNIVKEHSEDSVSKSNTTIDPINDIYKQNVGISREDRKVTSKTVYILNDEDIFSTNATESKTKLNEKSQKQILNIVDDDDLFKNAASNSNKIVEGVKTLGQVYIQKDIERDSESDDEIFKGKTNKKSEDKTMLGKAKKSLFDDLSDDDSELFNNKPKSKTLFYSDSDDDLFTGSSKRNKNRSATKQKEIKEDKSMFENRNKVTESKPSMSTQRADAVTKTTEPVFEDPLSMFGNKH